MCGKVASCNKCGGEGFYFLDYCINKYLDSNSFIFYSAFKKFNDGIMPWHGGYLQQTSSFIFNANFLNRVNNEYDKVKKSRLGNG
jgi:hypothetical protein